jgi:hypothetical protein
MRKRALARDNESGVALLSAILVLMLMSALLVGFITMVNSDQAASGINRDQTQAYAAAHAGVEKLTSDLGQMFQTNFSPTNAQVDALAAAANEPVLNGIQYQRPDGTSGYRIAYTDRVGPTGVAPGDGNPDLERWDGSSIKSGPYEGLVGLITPYTVEVTAKTTGNAEVRMRRTVQTVAIPVFQFGIFSENDLSFFAGPNFAFGGRVHSNQHLFLKQDGGNTLTLQDRVTAVGEIIRTHLANGVNGSHTATVRMALASGCPAAPAAINASCRNLADTEGSLVGNVGSAQNEPTWTNLSMGTYNGWIRNGRTGARRLDLPIVSDGARPVDIIRRPAAGSGELATSPIGRQRFYNMSTLRILLSDTRAELMAPNLPGAVGVPMPLQGTLNIVAGEVIAGTTLPAGNHPFAVTPATPDAAAVTNVLNQGFRTTGGTSTIGGWILINRQDRAGNWTDVTREVLRLGFSGKRITTGALWSPDTSNSCFAPHPNAIIRVQRYRDNIGSCAAGGPSFNGTDYWPNVFYDAREGMVRDTESARPTAPATVGGTTAGWYRMYWAGVMHYVELDVNNLRRWLNGDFGGVNTPACMNGGGPATCPMDVTGFVVYFSDRRTNKGPGPDNVVDLNPTVTPVGTAVEVTYGNDAETGELGFEDLINTNATSTPNNQLDHFYTDVDGNTRSPEDLNWELPIVPAASAPGRGTLETYGAYARLLPVANAAGPWNPNMMLRVPTANMEPNGVPSAGLPTSAASYKLVGYSGVYGVPVDRNVARVNRAFFFRRALKVINAGRGELPANGSQGLTISAENPVYIEGNFNACNPSINAAGQQLVNAANGYLWNGTCMGGVGFGNTPGSTAAGGDHVSAAVIADAVTLLSNAFNDIRTFVNPAHIGNNPAAPPLARSAATTWYRLGIISGKGLNFPRAATAPAGYDHTDWGTDGGAHNFLRYIEDWGGDTLNYRGSIISFYTNRQAVGIYKCCDTVYSPPGRGYNFDNEFLTPALLPPRTPMFRDINTLGFRQVLRPTQ